MENASHEPWGGVTDPIEHDPNNYRYLVHADTGYPGVGPHYMRSYFSHDIAGVAAPSGSFPYLRTSLVSHDHRKVFVGARHGLILEAPSNGIVLTSPTDLASRPDNLENFQAEHPTVLSGDTLLGMASNINNEVWVDPSSVTVVGLFRLTPQIETNMTFPTKILDKIAIDADLKLIELPEPTR